MGNWGPTLYYSCAWRLKLWGLAVNYQMLWEGSHSWCWVLLPTSFSAPCHFQIWDLVVRMTWEKPGNYHGVVFVFILSLTRLYKISPQQKSETVLTKGLQFPTKTKGFQHVNIVKNCFFQCFLLKPSIPETDGVIQRDVYDGIHLYPFTDLDTCTSWQVVYLMFIPCRLWCRVVSKHIISYHHCCSSIWISRLLLRIRETMNCCDQMSIHPVPSIFSHSTQQNFSRWSKTPPTHPLHTKQGDYQEIEKTNKPNSKVFWCIATPAGAGWCCPGTQQTIFSMEMTRYLSCACVNVDAQKKLHKSFLLKMTK